MITRTQKRRIHDQNEEHAKRAKASPLEAPSMETVGERTEMTLRSKPKRANWAEDEQIGLNVPDNSYKRSTRRQTNSGQSHQATKAKQSKRGTREASQLALTEPTARSNKVKEFESSLDEDEAAASLLGLADIALRSLGETKINTTPTVTPKLEPRLDPIKSDPVTEVSSRPVPSEVYNQPSGDSVTELSAPRFRDLCSEAIEPEVFFNNKWRSYRRCSIHVAAAYYTFYHQRCQMLQKISGSDSFARKYFFPLSLDPTYEARVLKSGNTLSQTPTVEEKDKSTSNTSSYSERALETSISPNLYSQSMLKLPDINSDSSSQAISLFTTVSPTPSHYNSPYAGQSQMYSQGSLHVPPQTQTTSRNMSMNPKPQQLLSQYGSLQSVPSVTSYPSSIAHKQFLSNQQFFPQQKQQLPLQHVHSQNVKPVLQATQPPSSKYSQVSLLTPLQQIASIPADTQAPKTQATKSDTFDKKISDVSEAQPTDCSKFNRPLESAKESDLTLSQAVAKLGESNKESALRQETKISTKDRTPQSSEIQTNIPSETVQKMLTIAQDLNHVLTSDENTRESKSQTSDVVSTDVKSDDGARGTGVETNMLSHNPQHSLPGKLPNSQDILASNCVRRSSLLLREVKVQQQQPSDSENFHSPPPRSTTLKVPGAPRKVRLRQRHDHNINAISPCGGYTGKLRSSMRLTDPKALTKSNPDRLHVLGNRSCNT